MTYRIRNLPQNELYWSSARAYHQPVAPQMIDPPAIRRIPQISNRRDHSTIGRTNRKYVDPWDLENYEYIQRHIKVSEETTPSPAGEPITSRFYYVPGSDEDDDHQSLEYFGPGADDDLMADDFNCTSGCYAGLDEELFYNAKYESIPDDPAYSMYYTDIESSSTDRTSSCGGSSVSTLQLHTPGFGVRASGRRSIVLPKPEPHIEFPPAPPPHEFYGYAVPHHPEEIMSRMMAPLPGTTLPPHHEMPYATYPRSVHNQRQAAAPPSMAGASSIAHSSSGGGPPTGASSEANTYCSLNECAYDCVPDHVPVYAISNPSTMRRRSAAGHSVQLPPNNFGLSKRGLLQIDYSFNWNNLHRIISK